MKYPERERVEKEGRSTKTLLVITKTTESINFILHDYEIIGYWDLAIFFGFHNVDYTSLSHRNEVSIVPLGLPRLTCH